VSVTSRATLGSARRVTLAPPACHIAAVQAGAGTPVLLVPGYTGSKEDFGPILDPLAEAGFRATAIDLPGQFESPGPAEPAAYATAALGAVVREVAAQLGGRVHLLGHSFGGLVARAAVIAEPQCFASLVLMSSGPAELGGVRRLSMDRLEPVLATHGLSGVWAALQAAAAAVPGYVAPSPEVAAFLEERFMAGSAHMLLGMAEALRREPDRVAELAATGVATLVVHGADDDAWPPAEQAEMARRLGARHEVIAAAAHSPAVEDPSTTADVLIAFWRGVTAEAD
jgi:pimeloyl-ACP methyl ester carboxylesterase